MSTDQGEYWQGNSPELHYSFDRILHIEYLGVKIPTSIWSWWNLGDNNKICVHCLISRYISLVKFTESKLWEKYGILTI